MYFECKALNILLSSSVRAQASEKLHCNLFWLKIKAKACLRQCQQSLRKCHDRVQENPVQAPVSGITHFLTAAKLARHLPIRLTVRRKSNMGKRN